MKDFELKVMHKANWASYYGDYVSFTSNGVLSIGGYDGLTELNAKEAKKLAGALEYWASLDNI